MRIRLSTHLLLLGSLLWAGSSLAQAPYPASQVITSITWDAKANIVHKADGSDTWPITWADDDQQYTVFGDGWGFAPKVPEKLSLGFAKINGPAASFTAVNIRSGTGEQKGDGPSGKKASGMLMVNKVLYMWVRNADNAGKQCQLAVSQDHAKTWTWSTWKLAELGYCAFANFGKDYTGALDGYVYTYSPDTPSAYDETDAVVLARVPKDKITSRADYEFFAKLDSGGKPLWTKDIAQRGPVFSFKGGCNRLDVTYNAPLKRFLMTMRSRAKAGGLDQFSIYDAPQPWGPWTTVFFTKQWDVDPGEAQHFPSKWISPDGKTLYLVFSGDDSFAVRKATLTVAAQPGTDGGPLLDSAPAPGTETGPTPGDTAVATDALTSDAEVAVDAATSRGEGDDGCSCLVAGKERFPTPLLLLVLCIGWLWRWR